MIYRCSSVNMSGLQTSGYSDKYFIHLYLKKFYLQINPSSLCQMYLCCPCCSVLDLKMTRCSPVHAVYSGSRLYVLAVCLHAIMLVHWCVDLPISMQCTHSAVNAADSLIVSTGLDSSARKQSSTGFSITGSLCWALHPN